MVNRAERMFVVAALFFFSGAVFDVVRHPDSSVLDVQESDSSALLLELAVYAIASIFMLLDWRKIVGALKSNLYLCALLMVIVLSTVWSGVPQFTIRRALVLVATTLFGVYLACRFDTVEQARLLSRTMAISMLLSIAFVIAAPNLGIDVAPYAGAWRGVFLQKNILARYVVLAIATFLCMAGARFYLRPVKIFWFGLAGALLAGSQSVGSFLMVIAVIALWFLFRPREIRWNKVALVAMGSVGAVVGMAVLLNLDELFRLLGRDSSLSGRVPLWGVLWTEFLQRPLLGYGFRGFWATQSADVWSQIGWKPLKAHNGFLDICLDLGVVGFALFAMNTVIAIRRCAAFVMRERSYQACWPLLILSLILISNVFETDLLRENAALWVLYISMTVSSQRALQALDAKSFPVTQQVVSKIGLIPLPGRAV